MRLFGLPTHVCKVQGYFSLGFLWLFFVCCALLGPLKRHRWICIICLLKADLEVRASRKRRIQLTTRQLLATEQDWCSNPAPCNRKREGGEVHRNVSSKTRACRNHPRPKGCAGCFWWARSPSVALVWMIAMPDHLRHLTKLAEPFKMDRAWGCCCELLILGGWRRPTRHWKAPYCGSVALCCIASLYILVTNVRFGATSWQVVECFTQTCFSAQSSLPLSTCVWVSWWSVSSLPVRCPKAKYARASLESHCRGIRISTLWPPIFVGFCMVLPPCVYWDLRTKTWPFCQNCLLRG